MNEPTWTHKGWFMLCPIKIAEPESFAPCFAARWAILEPWFTANELLQHIVNYSLSCLDPKFEPMFMYCVTGKWKA
jgi:hypothetical protein